jgi:hypothetical protein
MRPAAWPKKSARNRAGDSQLSCSFDSCTMSCCGDGPLSDYGPVWPPPKGRTKLTTASKRNVGRVWREWWAKKLKNLRGEGTKEG